MWLSKANLRRGCLEVVDHDESGLFQGIEFRNNLLESYLVVSRYLQLDV